MAKFGKTLYLNSESETEFREFGAPTLLQLIEHLRGSKDFTQMEREWLAELLDPNGKSEMCLLVRQRKTGPNRGLSRERSIVIYERMKDLVEFQEIKVEATVQQIIEEIEKCGEKIGRSTILKIWAEYKAASLSD